MWIVACTPYGYEIAEVVKEHPEVVYVRRPGFSSEGHIHRFDVVFTGSEAECRRLLEQLKTSRDLERQSKQKAVTARINRDCSIIERAYAAQKMSS